MPLFSYARSLLSKLLCAGCMMTAKMSESSCYVLLAICVLVRLDVAHGYIWKTLYLDQTEHCEMVIRNDDMAEGDTYVVMSTSTQESQWLQRPAECSLAFNFGDRHMSMRVESWQCPDSRREPFIAVYENCQGLRTNLVAIMNCSSVSVEAPATLSSGSCLSLYHYRGQSKAGYHFKMLVTAEEEIIAFPAGGVAAVLVLCIVGVMVLVKFICVITDYENRLPMLNLDPAEERQIIASASQAIQAARDRYHMDTPPPHTAASTTSAENLLEVEPRFSAQVVATDQGHRVLRVTHSNGSSGRPSTSRTTTAEFDYDFVNAQVVDRPSAVAPSLNRFPSFKGASIWRSK